MTNTQNQVATECATCLCESDIDVAVACDAQCWAFIGCLRENCADELSGGTDGEIAACATSECMATIGGATAAGPIGDVIAADCQVCSTVPPGDDAGDDAGAL